MHTRRSLIKSCTLTLLITTLASGTLAKSCLWKVTSESGTLYLQGSIHLLKADNYPLAPAIEDAYAASTALVLEVDMKEMAAPEAQQNIGTKALLPAGESLSQILDEDSYQALTAACEKAGLPIAALERFKPWFAAMTVSLTQLQRMGFNGQYGLDTYFAGKAEADGKKVIGLESVEFQINLLASLAAENPNDYTQRALAALKDIQADTDALVNAWETGDIDALGALISKSFEGYPHLYKTFVQDRNERWLKTLQHLLETSEIHMVVIGAGHLSDEKGLIELLKEKGYTLEQL